MKKIICIICVIVICIVLSVTYAYSMYTKNKNEVKRFNNDFLTYTETEFYGNELATIINLAIDTNEAYNIQKDLNGKYIEDDSYSVRVDIYLSDTEKEYSMELINSGGISNFVNNYSNIKFKCTKVEYHKRTGRISYIYIKQIS